MDLELSLWSHFEVIAWVLSLNVGYFSFYPLGYGSLSRWFDKGHRAGFLKT